jgi:hypothetical protein
MVASAFSNSPEQWSIEMNDKLAEHFSSYDLDIKAELVEALKNRCLLWYKNLTETKFYEGLALIVLSIIGLIREIQFSKLKKIVKESKDSSLRPE